MDILYQGAEAILYLDKYLGQKAIVKKRIKKTYRHPELDERLRRQRTKREAKVILRLLDQGINVPMVYDVDLAQSTIVLEFIEGTKLDKYIDQNPDKAMEIGKKIGEILFKIHKANIVHNDFTTSNMIINDQGIFVIDLGMSFDSHRIEDKAYDVLLFKRAINARHCKTFHRLWSGFEQGYEDKKVLKYSKVLEKRGRYVQR